MKMKLTKKEIKSLAEMLVEFTEVEDIIIDDVEIRVRGKKGDSNGLHGMAIYRTNDIRTIYAHAHNKCVEAEKNLRKIKKLETNASMAARMENIEW